MYDVYERNINIRLLPIDSNTVLLTASLLDLNHSITTEVKLDLATEKIVDADVKMMRAPYEQCSKAKDTIRTIIGFKIERGVNKKIADAIGHTHGCIHVVEILQNAMRFAASMLIGVRAGYGTFEKRKELSEEERLEKVMPYLKNTCVVFKEE
ncbi:MAG: DUF2889 domain-containing protein [Deltaproteobacteria bacterium]|nr:DUF2889 domain-containing protein [Deltaproteobacteria bacterium]MCL5276508.1 DUF2889 domain-containing protein [Deltaproteobacteria bacterium]